jgi:sugar phosphate isomerase/epimerase
MTKAIVGYSGFVGSNLLQFYKFDYFYNSQNFSEAKNKNFDELYFCGIPALKWKANKYPQEDLDTIENIQNILKTIKVNKFILISTIDVYENVDLGNDEDYDCDYIINHPYGRNRYIFEYFIKTNFTDYHIIRLPALFGKGLKKNIIFDLINNNQVENIPINSSFQWYNLEWLKNDIDIIRKNNIQICNLFTEPVESSEIINLFKYNIHKLNNNAKKLIYNCKSKYANLFNSSINGYIRDKNVVIECIQKFIDVTNLKKERLCVSNICVKTLSQFQFACILKLFGIQNIQVAPTTLIDDWKNINNLDLSVFTKQHLHVYSFQSITYCLNNLNIFNDNNRRELLLHLHKIIDKAVENGVKVLVFGCPKNRQVADNSNQTENNEIFTCFFKELGIYCENKYITICIEPNSKKYNCNFINKIEEAGEIVKNINHHNIKMMVDIGNAFMEDDNLQKIYEYKDIIYNIDVAQESMKSFDKVNYIDKHSQFKNILNNINYKNKINLEMIINDKENELEILCSSLNNFINIYSDVYLKI